MRRRLSVMAVITVAVVALLAGPAAAGETKFSETCSEVFGQGAVGDLDKDTDPAPDSMVAPGQNVDVKLRWPAKVVAGERSHRVMECASTNGEEPWLWAERRMVTAEGTTTLSMAVPSGLAGGSEVCSQSILVTKGSFGPVTRWSETMCYRVATVEKKVMEPLSRRSPAPPESETTSTTDEYKRKKEEEKRKKEEEKRKKEEEEKRRREEEERKKKEATTTTTVTMPSTTVTTVAAAPTTTSTAPPPVAAPSPPPSRTPLAAPAAPPPRAPVTRPASQQASGPQAAAPAGQLARTGTGALGLFLLGGVTLIAGRLLRRAFPARRSSAGLVLQGDRQPAAGAAEGSAVLHAPEGLTDDAGKVVPDRP